MVLRIAALHGHDPTGPHVTAELLARASTRARPSTIRAAQVFKTAPEHGSAGGRSSAGAWSSSPR